MSAVQPIPAALDIQNIRLTNLAMDDALNAIDAALVTHTPSRVAFVNADCVNIASHNAHYRADLEAMDWVFIDGVGMRIAGRMLHQPVRDNVNGTDLFPRLCAELAQHRRRLYLLGARPGVAQAAAAWAAASFPGLEIAGTRDGYFDDADTPTVIEDIRRSGADVLLVALGAPRQEAWIHHHLEETGATVGIGVGGLFDYYAGRIPRAPAWMRHAGLEWVWRLVQEPGRLWRRYLLGNGVFLARIATTWLTQHLGGARHDRT